jgi:hypothetical protein
VYIQAVRPRIAWVKPLSYEVNIDETQNIIEALINEPVNPKQPIFGTYDVAKTRIELEIKLPEAINKGKRKIAKMKAASGTLMLTEGKGEDEGDLEEEQETEKEPEPVKKKGKVIITKPSKPSTAVFTRKSNRKGGTDVVFSKPPLSLEERLKQMEEGAGITNFKALKYETRTDAEKW